MLCQCPKLTPLQSRLVASLSALILLGLIYWSLSNPSFAEAAELAVDGSGNLRRGEDHNWHRIPDGVVLDDDDEEQDEVEDDVQHGGLRMKRASTQAQIQGNDIGTLFDAAAGSLTIWKYPNRFITGDHADNGTGLPSTIPGLGQTRSDSDEGTTIYISANTCNQPLWNGTGVQDHAPPQLTLYVAQFAGNQNLGSTGSQQYVHNFTKGWVNATITVPAATTGDWYMAVSAPKLSSNFSGSWTYSLAASIDDYFYRADSTQFLHLVDTDDNSALLFTDNLTEADASSDEYKGWTNLTAPPFILFATNNNFTGTMGIENSFCGLQTFVKNYSQIAASQDDLGGNDTRVQMGMTTRGLGHKPKQQFYLSDLQASTPYTAWLAMEGNSTASGDGVVNGGGTVWGAGVNVPTKTDGNCQLMFNLTFCSEVAYAVPANPTNSNVSSFEKLQAFYDNYTTTWYKPFNYTLAQIPCNTTSDAQYSMAKTCTDCAAAYKEWLCAVSIPRCEDFSNPAEYLQPRNMGQQFYNNNSMLEDHILQTSYAPMPGAPTIQGSNAFQQTFISSFATNQSRNLAIDETIKPGPYKEVLPCDDLCYSLMQSCPSSMNFACPYPGRGLEAGYRRRNASSGNVECSYLGAYFYRNEAVGAGLVVWRSVGLAIILGVLIMR